MERGVIVYHYICYSVSNSYWARSMYAVTVKPMCSLINTVLQLIRHLVCSCLFAREHNISGDEKSSDHAKPRQNRRVQFSYYRHQSLPGATGTIFRCKQRSRRLCRVTQMKSNPNFFYWRQGLRCSFGSLLTDSSFWENVCTAYHYPKESFRTEETRYRREIPIPQSYTTRRRECHSVRC